MGASQGKFSKRKPIFDKITVECYSCNKLDHFSDQCPQKKLNRAPSNIPRRRCHQKGGHHKAKIATSDDTDGKVYMFCVVEKKMVKAAEWVVDSGASCQMTLDCEILIDYREMSEAKP